MQDEFINLIKKYDTKNVLDSIASFPEQCKSSWNTPSNNVNRKTVKNILVAGMGGSALGAHILKSLDIFKVPMSISSDYTIPKWVDGDTLVLAISYSGNTEETISSANMAVESGATVVCITAGGELKEFAAKNNLEVYNLDANQNPSGQPRFGVEFMIMKIIKACMDYNLCALTNEEVENSLKELDAWQESFQTENKLDKVYNQAMKIINKIPVFVYCEHLANLGLFARNQMNETAKTLALAHELPELNHHLMEGLEFPTSNKDILNFIFFESSVYSDKIKKRISLTKDVLHKQGISYMEINTEGFTKLSQALIGMLHAMYLAYTLSIIHEKDPSVTPWVNYFKEKLNA